MSDEARIIVGDCRESMAALEPDSVDAIVTDPPYGISFMGKGWDHGVPGVEFWVEALRVAQPGAHLLAFGGTRTYHRLACAIEDAGWEIRDCVMWVYGSGFPKSLDVSKAIDKARDDSADILRVTTFMADAADRIGVTRADVDAHMGTSDMGGWWLSRLQHRCQCPKWDQWLRLKSLLGLSDEMDAVVWRLNGRKGRPGEAWYEREVVGSRITGAAMSKSASGVEMGTGGTCFGSGTNEVDITAPATDAARQWQGWGTALKPAWEPIIVARKPLAGTVAGNVQRYGTGALNIDGCRIATSDNLGGGTYGGAFSASRNPDGSLCKAIGSGDKGRWPANVIHDGSDEVVALFPREAGAQARVKGTEASAASTGNVTGERARVAGAFHADTGSAARFFYCAKPSRREREAGLREAGGTVREAGGAQHTANVRQAANHHPTVKPIALMRYLCRLVTPPRGIVLDPFAGSGTTGCAARLEGFRFLGLEQSDEYAEIARARITHHDVEREPSEAPLFEGTA